MPSPFSHLEESLSASRIGTYLHRDWELRMFSQ